MRFCPLVCRLPICVLAALIAAFLTFPTAVRGQLTTAEEKGLPPNSVFHLGDVDAVNLQNGNLHISIPILNVKQRSGSNLSWDFVFDTLGWTKSWLPDYCPQPDLPILVFPGAPESDPPPPCPTTGRFIVQENSGLYNWRFTSPIDWDISYTQTTQACPIPIVHETFLEYDAYDSRTNWLVYDPQGTAHPVPIRTENYVPDPAVGRTQCLGSTQKGTATDGSGIFFDVGADGYDPVSSTTYMKDGTQSKPSAVGLRDSNGNLMTYDADTLNRNLVTTSYDPNYQPSNPLSRPQYVIYTVHDSNGVPQQYRADYVTVHFVSAMCGPADPIQPCDEGGGDAIEISRLTLPDQKAYVFTYNANSPGELARLDLPSGASIEYTYTDFFSVKPPVKQGTVLLPRTVVGGRGVASRKVTVDGRVYLWTYGSTPAGSSPAGSTVTDPDGNIQVHDFEQIQMGSGSQFIQSGTLYEMNVSYLDPQGHTLRTVHTDYASELTPLDGSIPKQSIVNVRPIRKTTTFDNGLVSKTETDYDTFSYTNCGTCSTVGTGSRMNPKAVREYGFGNGAPGALLRRTTYSYLHEGQPAYVGFNIVDKPTTITVYDGSGNQVSQTVNEYDNYGRTGQTMQASSAIRHDATYGTAFTTRGNLTATSKWLNTTGGFITATNQYDDAGNVLSVVDPKGNRTSYSFTDAWTGAQCAPGGSLNTLPSGATKAFPTVITNALGQSVSMTHNSCTGTTASATDLNGHTTTATYDLFNRPKHVTFPAGGVRDTCYTDDPNGGCSGSIWSMIETTAMTSTASMVSTTVFDGLGRAKQTQVNSDPQGVDYADTETDDQGKVKKAYNPYRVSSGAYTTYTYDGLGRKRVQTNPDGTTVQLSYSGNNTTSTDEAANQWQRITDAFGRLVGVFEPNGAKTVYTYDTLGNLKCVDQWGTGAVGAACSSSKSRSFVYDSLSRLLSSTNPETGTVSYGYTAGGTLCAGDVTLPCTKTDARGVVLTYLYDALNRITSKHASDNTLWDDYAYDQWAPGIGKLTQTWSYWTTSHVFFYDDMGRLTGESYTDPGSNGWQTAHWANYDLAGNMTAMGYPGGRIVDEVFDTAGRLAKISNRANGTTPTFDFISGSTPLPNPGDTSTGGIQYTPDGAPQSYVLGNGVGQFNGYNSRLQPCHTMVSTPVLGGTMSALLAGIGPGNLLDRQSFYNSSASSPCGSEAGNNGNIYSIADNRLVGNSQSFSYDNLDRLTTAARSDGAYNHTYNYPDFFGNMLIHDNLASPSSVAWNIDQSTNRLLRSHNGGVTWGDNVYDASGNLQSVSDGISPTVTYQYNALNQLYAVNNGATAAYSYNGLDERVYKTTPTGWVDYLYFNGQPMTEHTSAGVWTDYIYAGGQKIAKVDSSETRLHTQGTFATTERAAAWAFSGPIIGYTIKPHDKLVWKQYQTGTARGGLGIGLATPTGWLWLNWIVFDTDGQMINSDGYLNVWHNRVVDLNAYAGSIVSIADLLTDANTGVGAWNVWYKDMVLLSADGTVTPIYTGQTGLSLPLSTTDNPANQSQTVEVATTTPGGGALAGSDTTRYYLDDHLGTTQMELSAGGWPVWEGQFTPFGQEIVNATVLPTDQADGSSMHYKFTGKERDAESGLDYFGARYYASTVGRWMSPDWADKPEAVPYSSLPDPQSLNLYNYVGNNPLSRVDADGHFADFYNTDGRKVGTDDVKDGKNYVVLNGKEAGNMEKHGYKSVPDSAVLLPGNAVRDAISASVNSSNSPNSTDTKGGFHEEGGLYGTTANGTQVAVPAVPGAVADPLKDDGAHINTANPANAALAGSVVSIDGKWHIHPSGTESTGGNSFGGGGMTLGTTTTGSFKQSPSSQDFRAQTYGTNIVVGAGNNRVSFYNSQKTIGSMDFSTFMSIGR